MILRNHAWLGTFMPCVHGASALYLRSVQIPYVDLVEVIIPHLSDGGIDDRVSSS